jgi:hypothetical protein
MNVEVILNKTKCDIIFKSHLFSHNFSSVPNPACACGFRLQTTKHLFSCPLFTELRYKLGLLPNFNILKCNNSSMNTKFQILFSVILH